MGHLSDTEPSDEVKPDYKNINTSGTKFLKSSFEKKYGPDDEIGN
jgi:hypothetical protein